MIEKSKSVARCCSTPITLAAATAVALLFVSCGKKEEDKPETSGPESSQGAILESAQKTVDEANARTRKVDDKTKEVSGSPEE